ncbi:MAG: hypothetical protein EOP48_21415 [Sphingobacteriales bacterium]|nr:MAG: hypothetical protein EOP48_21415 [Sphingobacteriales bacterium]
MLISHEELFLHTIQDLRTKIQSNKPYDLIRACGLCRHLLLDGHPLAHQVNRKLKIPITFHIADFTETPLWIKGKKMHGGWRTIQPFVDKTRIVKVGEFMSTKIMYRMDYEYTVKEILNAGAHYFGGVHSGNPDKKQAFLTRFDIGNDYELKKSFIAIRSICAVILKSMEPLETAIKEHTHAGGFSPQSLAD